MIVLGIDPGTVRIGYSVLECDANRIHMHEAGLIPIQSTKQEDRLKELHEGINHLIGKWKPSALAIERLFFTKNQKTAISVAEARGVVLLTTTLAHINVYEYTPLEVKKIITGSGSADKLQVKKMVELTVASSRGMKARDDVFDAIAIALACYFQERHTFKIKGL